MSIRSFIAVVVTVVWAANLLAAIIYRPYSPPLELHAIMGLIAGGLFGREAFNRARDGNGNGNGNGNGRTRE